MQKALSLNNTASADTALRKLQSVVRNNVNANFGARLNLVEQRDSAGDIPPRLDLALCPSGRAEWAGR